MAITAHGKIHGCTIQLDSQLNIPDGAEVEVTVVVTSPKPPWGEGLKRSAGALADMPEFESIFEQIAKDRESATFRESDS